MKTKRFIAARTSLQSKHPAVPGGTCREIMVPVDFSVSSVRALRHAAALAQKENAHLTLLNVIEEPVSFRSFDKPFRERCRLESRASGLEDLARRELPHDVAAHIVVCEGNPATEITRMAAQRHTDLIVVGCHRHHWLVRLFRGHTAVRVMEQAPCPVVVLNESRARHSKPASRSLPGERGTAAGGTASERIALLPDRLREQGNPLPHSTRAAA